MQIKTWVGITILFFGGVVLHQSLQNNHDNYLEQQKIQDQQQAQRVLNEGFTDCMSRAKAAYGSREINYCMAQYHATADYCLTLPDIVGGTIYADYQQDKNNCATQFPGATIVNYGTNP